jgi:4-hydroxymandelate oxidase
VTQTPAPAARPIVPRVDLVNVLEYEAQAARRLTPGVLAQIAGGDRAAFERMIIRPRMMVPAVDLDLSLTLFGVSHFAPIIVAPVANQQQFHADAERATIKGASAARAAVVISSRTSTPVEELVSAATSPVWYQVFATEANAQAQVARAVKAGCRAVVVTVGAMPAAGGRVVAASGTREWDAVSAIKKDAGVPVIVKGVTTTQATARALERGADGIVVSNYGALIGGVTTAAVASLSGVVAAAAAKVPVFLDGSLRRGTDVLKALALGATAVLVARPVMWGLAAYGAEGVQGVVEMLQTELGRYMAMSGTPTLKAIHPGMVRTDRPPASRLTRPAGARSTP